MPIHRYLIETEKKDYPCDDYILYPMHGVQCIVVDEAQTDTFFITAPVVAYHDYQSGVTLEAFAQLREDEIAAAKAAQIDLAEKAKRPGIDAQ